MSRPAVSRTMVERSGLAGLLANPGDSRLGIGTSSAMPVSGSMIRAFGVTGFNARKLNDS